MLKYMSTKTFNLSLPQELVKIIDHQATLHFSSRSEYIKTAIISRLRSEGIEHSLSPLYRSADELQQAKLKKFIDKTLRSSATS
jgi:Arc/MetJ-type ribon-helix-helix transcriptional regulator